MGRFMALPDFAQKFFKRYADGMTVSGFNPENLGFISDAPLQQDPETYIKVFDKTRQGGRAGGRTGNTGPPNGGTGSGGFGRENWAGIASKQTFGGPVDNFLLGYFDLRKVHNAGKTYCKSMY